MSDVCVELPLLSFTPPMSVEVLEAEICRRSANLTAAEAEWLMLIAEYDDRHGWVEHGLESCAHWLAWQCSLDLRSAREKVRVGHALLRFPVIATAMLSGLLSYAKVRAITRIATPDIQQALVDLAAVATSNQVEQFVTAWRLREAAAERQADRAWHERGVFIRHHDGSITFTVRLPAEAGKVFQTAIEQFMSADLSDTRAQRRADAVVAMAEQALAHLADPPGSETRYLASIHVDDDVFDTPANHPHGHCCVTAGNATGSDDPVAVPRSTARRLLCDAVREGLLDDDHGNLVRVGKPSRTLPRRLRRLILRRDNGCRWPGCDRKGWVDIHHIIHWLDNGQHEPDNLVSLCRYHHRRVHEGGWTITGDPRRHDALTFHHPNGTPLDPYPPLIPGDPTQIDNYGHTPDDGKCGWLGDDLDTEWALDVIQGNAGITLPDQPPPPHTPQGVFTDTWLQGWTIDPDEL